MGSSRADFFRRAALMTMTTLIRCGALIDGTGAEPRRGASLLIENQTIVAINANGDGPRGAEVVDASELTVMPGMIDCHVHLSSWPMSIQQRLLTPYSLFVAQ